MAQCNLQASSFKSREVNISLLICIIWVLLDVCYVNVVLHIQGLHDGYWILHCMTNSQRRCRQIPALKNKDLHYCCHLQLISNKNILLSSFADSTFPFSYNRQLLGKDSTDIDIALDNMTGQNFCEKVNEYSELLGEEQKGIGVIQWYAIFIILFPASISYYCYLSLFLSLIWSSSAAAINSLRSQSTSAHSLSNKFHDLFAIISFMLV